MKISIIGPETCVDKTRKVKELLFKIKETFGPAAIIQSGGNSSGIEREVKKFSLEFEMKYKEFNPSFTGKNLYSALDEGYYTKGRHPSHFHNRYERMLQETDILFIGQEVGTSDKLYEAIKKRAEKKKIRTTVI